jgi:hypothetical protein
LWVVVLSLVQHLSPVFLPCVVVASVSEVWGRSVQRLYMKGERDEIFLWKRLFPQSKAVVISFVVSIGMPVLSS